MPSVTLVTTLHDSSGWSIEHLKEHASLFDELYERRLVVATRGTSMGVIETLQGTGWTLISQRSKVGVEYISDSRRRVLKAGLESGSKFMHIIDMDRLLHWAKHYPKELKEITNFIPSHKFLIIGRTDRAFSTHPRNQTETEALANKVFSLIYGKDVDITGASRGVSQEATEIILKSSNGSYFDSDSEWPTILFTAGVEIGYVEVEGLEWETRLKRHEMTLPDGKRVDVKNYYESNPESWVYRTMLAYRIAKTALNTYRGIQET
jgi:hypothetical protein